MRTSGWKFEGVGLEKISNKREVESCKVTREVTFDKLFRYFIMYLGQPKCWGMDEWSPPQCTTLFFSKTKV